MAELEDALTKIVAALTKARIQYVIVGGFAAILQGSPRTTTDIDIIVRLSNHNLDEMLDAFRTEGFDLQESQIRLAFKEGANASIFISHSVIRIDLKQAKKPDEFEVLDQAREELFKGIKIQMASIDQILYGKVLYLGDISDLSDDDLLEFNDVRDFINVYNASRGTVNLEWLKQKVADKGLTDTLMRLLKQVQR